VVHFKISFLDFRQISPERSRSI